MNNFGRFGVIFCYQRHYSSLVGNPARPEYLAKLRECYRFEEHKQIVVPIFKKALLFGNQVAVKDSSGEYSYLQLYVNSKRLSRQISNICGSGSSSSVGFFFSNDVLSILCLWACWMSGQVFIPLKTDYAYENLQGVVTESNVKMILTSKKHIELGRQLAESNEIALLSMDHGFVKNQIHTFNFNREIFMADKFVFFESLLQNNFYTNSEAMQVYFEGYEGHENGLRKYVLSHKHINTQMKECVRIWNMTADDRVLNILPSHQVNSYINTTVFPLVAGSTLQIHDPFDAINAWGLILGINVPIKERINVLIAEPKVYRVLINEYEKIFSKNSRMVEYIKDYCLTKIRLMISCGEELPSETYSKWLKITGHCLLENSSITKPKPIDEEKNSVDDSNKDHITKIGSHLIAPNSKIRIIDQKNNILLESCGIPKKHSYSAAKIVIGSLWVSPSGNDEFISTGEVVAYHDGVFTTLGKCHGIK